MRLALALLLAGGLVLGAAPVASAEHTCDLQPIVDPVELGTCLAVCIAEHVLANQDPDCRFVH